MGAWETGWCLICTVAATMREIRIMPTIQHKRAELVFVLG
jgi:hypothetical protein